VQLKKNNNNSFEGIAVGVVNNILHSTFRSSSVYLNNILVLQSDHNYHYRAYLQTILNYGSDASESLLAFQGYFPNIERITAEKYFYPDTNETLKNVFQKSNKVELFEKFMEIFLIKPNCLLTMLI